MSPRRWVPLVVLLLASVVGCDRVPEEVAGPAEEVASELRSAAEEAASELLERGGAQDGEAGGGGGEGAGGVGPGGDGAGGGDAGGEGPGGDAAGGDGAAGEGGQAAATDDLGSVGANGRAMLRADHPSMVVEVDVQEGLDPDPGALDHLLAVLGSVSDKPGGIVQAGGNRFSSDRTSWTTADLRAVAEQHRSNHSDDRTVAVYVLYVRGGFADEDALGVAHNASEVAVFPERWRGALSQTLGSTSAVERAVLVHEAGHLLGLVELTYDSRFDREDPERPGHSTERDSVMYWAIESTAIGQVFSGPPPDDFDEHDRADLRFLRTGSY